MAFTQTQLDALNEAIAQGALTVEYGDKKVTYRSLDEMYRIRDTMNQEISNKPINGRRFAAFDKGLK